MLNETDEYYIDLTSKILIFRKYPTITMNTMWPWWMDY